MSISSEINRINNNISDSLAVVAAKGVSVAEGAISDDLPGLIAQIAAEETLTQSEYDALVAADADIPGKIYYIIEGD